MSPAQIKNKYQKRIKAIMERIAMLLRGRNHTVEGPDFWDCDEYRWEMLIDGDVDISFKIIESEQYDGEKGGVNFGIDIVEVGGRVLGGLTPYNYTPEVWVPRKDKEAVEARFCLMEDSDDDTIIPLIEERHDASPKVETKRAANRRKAR